MPALKKCLPPPRFHPPPLPPYHKKGLGSAAVGLYLTQFPMWATQQPLLLHAVVYLKRNRARNARLFAV